MSWLPPRATGVTWSIVVAVLPQPHQQVRPLLANTLARSLRQPGGAFQAMFLVCLR